MNMNFLISESSIELLQKGFNKPLMKIIYSTIQKYLQQFDKILDDLKLTEEEKILVKNLRASNYDLPFLGD